MSVRVVVFDLGGVVMRICRTWGEACARAGLPAPEADRFARFELRETRSALTDQYQSGAISSEAYFSGIADATDGLYNASEVERVHRAWVMQEYPGIRTLIEELNGAGITTACLSNTNHAHWEGLIRGNGAPKSEACLAIQRRLVSHELGAVKPDEKIYRLAEDALGASPDELLFFDDLEPNVISARRYGWHSEQIDHEGDTARQARSHLRAYGLM